MILVQQDSLLKIHDFSYVCLLMVNQEPFKEGSEIHAFSAIYFLDSSQYAYGLKLYTHQIHRAESDLHFFL